MALQAAMCLADSQRNQATPTPRGSIQRKKTHKKSDQQGEFVTKGCGSAEKVPDGIRYFALHTRWNKDRGLKTQLSPNSDPQKA